jgi:hypothetical protein
MTVFGGPRHRFCGNQIHGFWVPQIRVLLRSTAIGFGQLGLAGVTPGIEMRRKKHQRAEDVGLCPTHKADRGPQLFAFTLERNGQLIPHE